MPNSDTRSDEAVKKRDPWLGLFLLLVAALVVVFSRSIEALGFGANFDPGPRAFPLGLSTLLAVGGLVELWDGLFRTQSNPNGNKQAQGSQKTILLLLACFLLYVVVLPLMGFALSTLLIATGMMVLLGNSLKLSAIVSIILITIIYLLFVILFKVPLPGGVLNLPF